MSVHCFISLWFNIPGLLVRGDVCVALGTVRSLVSPLGWWKVIHLSILHVCVVPLFQVHGDAVGGGADER